MKTYSIESISTVCRRGERMKIKNFKSSETMHGFLNTGSNALHWRESAQGLKSGTYAYAGGQWHNVKSLDSSLLAHI